MKMLRAKKIKDIWEQVEKRIGSVAIVQGMMLIRVLLVVVGICHWNACLFWIVGATDSIVTDFMPAWKPQTPSARLFLQQSEPELKNSKTGSILGP